MRKGLKPAGGPTANTRSGPLRVLFLCSRNRRRSPTAEHVFAGLAGVETASAGLADDADEVVTSDHIAWADIVFVMEPVHRRRLERTFPGALKGVRIVSLDIADKYAFMDPQLVELLRRRVTPLLKRHGPRREAVG